MSVGSVGLYGVGDRGLLAEAVTKDVFARIRLREVAVGDDVDAGRAHREYRRLQAFGKWVDGHSRVGECGPKQSQVLVRLDHRLRQLRRLRLVRSIVLD